MRIRPATFSVLALALALRPAPAQEIHFPEARYLEHVRFLASDELEGRGTGEPGNARAAAYLATRFKAFRLEPIDEAGTFRQPFEVAVGLRPGEGNRLAVLGAGGEVPLAFESDFMPFSFSGSGTVDAEAVFAGYGAVLPDGAYDDYAGLDMKGKAVVVLRGAPEGGPFAGHHGEDARLLLTKARHAWTRGAAALLVVNDPRAHGGEADALLPFRQGSGDHSLSLPALHLKGSAATRALGIDLRERQEEIDRGLRPRSGPLPGLRVRLEARVEREKRPVDNVVGSLPGSDPDLRREIVVLGAHFDHLGRGDLGRSTAPESIGEIHNGADDNASGTAGLLELARVLAGRREVLRRRVVFAAFNAEEVGLLGSRHLVERFPWPMENVVAMVNLDMIGRSQEDRVSAIGTGTSPGFATLVEEANRGPGLKVHLVPSPHGGFGGSDHMSFTARSIPVLFFFTGAHPDYHRPSDDVEKINAAAAVRILALVAGVVERLASTPERPAYVEVRPEPRGAVTGGRGGGASLGTVPDYGHEGPGLRLAGVSPGGAAEKAGLRAGDIVTSIAHLEVGTIHDFMNALAAFHPGDKVVLKVRRDGKEIEVEATLGRRGGGQR